MAELQLQLPSINVLDQSQKEVLMAQCFNVKHKEGETLFSQDKPVSYLMFLVTGLVKVYREEPNNRSLILKIVGPGTYISLTSIFYENRYQSSCIALSDCDVIYISREVFKELLAENGNFALKTLELLSAESVYYIKKLMQLPQKQVPGRIAEILLFFSESIFKSNNYILPLSRQELADFAFSTKESVSRTLTEFKNDRIIDIDDRMVSLKSIELLQILCKLG